MTGGPLARGRFQDDELGLLLLRRQHDGDPGLDDAGLLAGDVATGGRPGDACDRRTGR